MEEEVYDIIKKIIKYKEDTDIRPLCACFVADIMPEIKECVKNTLNKLIDDGKIHYSPTVTDDTFTLN